MSVPLNLQPVFRSMRLDLETARNELLANQDEIDSEYRLGFSMDIAAHIDAALDMIPDV